MVYICLMAGWPVAGFQLVEILITRPVAGFQLVEILITHDCGATPQWHENSGGVCRCALCVSLWY